MSTRLVALQQTDPPVVFLPSISNDNERLKTTYGLVRCISYQLVLRVEKCVAHWTFASYK